MNQEMQLKCYPNHYQSFRYMSDRYLMPMYASRPIAPDDYIAYLLDKETD